MEKINLRHDLFKLFQRSKTDPVLANIVIDGFSTGFVQPRKPRNPSLPHMTSSSSVKDELGGAKSSSAGGRVSGRLSRLFTCKDSTRYSRLEIMAPFGRVPQFNWSGPTVMKSGSIETTLFTATTSKLKYKPAQIEPNAKSELFTVCAITALHLARRDWFYESPEAHFTRQADP
jgi:hypothetical protein